MSSENKTKDQLISEKDQLRRMIDDLRSQIPSYKKTIEKLQADTVECRQTGEALQKNEERFRFLYGKSVALDFSVCPISRVVNGMFEVG